MRAESSSMRCAWQWQADFRPLLCGQGLRTIPAFSLPNTGFSENARGLNKSRNSLEAVTVNQPSFLVRLNLTTAIRAPAEH